MKEEHGLQKQVGMIVRSMSYITSNFTKIVDWRLAVFYYIMIVACLGGILASLFLGKTFLFDETPVGIVSAYAYGGSAYPRSRMTRPRGTLTSAPPPSWYVHALSREILVFFTSSPSDPDPLARRPNCRAPARLRSR